MTASSADQVPISHNAKGLTLVCVLLALAMVILAICMLFPIRWDGLGILGAGALFYPLHLLLVTALSLVLGLVRFDGEPVWPKERVPSPVCCRSPWP